MTVEGAHLDRMNCVHSHMLELICCLFVSSFVARIWLSRSVRCGWCRFLRQIIRPTRPAELLSAHHCVYTSPSPWRARATAAPCVPIVRDISQSWSYRHIVRPLVHSRSFTLTSQGVSISLRPGVRFYSIVLYLYLTNDVKSAKGYSSNPLNCPIYHYF